jgi:hypothetical protein
VLHRHAEAGPSYPHAWQPAKNGHLASSDERWRGNVRPAVCLEGGRIPIAVVVLLAGLCFTMPPGGSRALAQADAGRPAQSPSTAIFLNSRNDQCYDNGIAEAIEQLTKAEQRRINAAGGVLRRTLDLQLLDDRQDDARAVANMKQALANPNIVAMIGLSQTARAKAVFDAVGADIGASGVPFLSDITVNSIFEKQGNVFTMRPSQDDQRVPMIEAFIKERAIKRPAFVGLKDQLFSSSLGDGLKNSEVVRLIADHRLAAKADPAAIAAVVADLKQKDAELVILAVGGARTTEILTALAAAGVTPALFVTGNIDAIVARSGGEYPGDIFQLAWDNLPNIFSERLRARVARNGSSGAPRCRRPLAGGRASAKSALPPCRTCSTAATCSPSAAAPSTPTWSRSSPKRSSRRIPAPARQGCAPTC